MPKSAKSTRGKKGAEPYSFTEPVIRVAKKTTKDPSKVQNTDSTPKFRRKKPTYAVFHKQADKGNSADIVGRSDLKQWKRSSGRDKSWKTFGRLRVSKDRLDLLIQSNGHPVSLGWRFSTMRAPCTFAKGKGLYINKQSNPKKCRPPMSSIAERLADEQAGRRPHSNGWFAYRRRQETKFLKSQAIEPRGPSMQSPYFLRLSLGCGTVHMTAERFLTEIPLEKPGQCTVFDKPEGLKLSRFLRNDSHADIYAVGRDPTNPCARYHAHVFLRDGFVGNWQTFMRRKVDRLRQSKAFHAETVHEGRRVVIMQVDGPVRVDFRIQDQNKEFPLLSGSGKKPKLRQRHYKFSYASVVKGEHKQAVKPNNQAYKAWEDRTKGKKKANSASSHHETPLPTGKALENRAKGKKKANSASSHHGTLLATGTTLENGRKGTQMKNSAASMHYGAQVGNQNRKSACVC